MQYISVKLGLSRGGKNWPPPNESLLHIRNFFIEFSKKSPYLKKVCRGGFRNDFLVRQVWIKSKTFSALMIYFNLERFWYFTSRKWRRLNPPLKSHLPRIYCICGFLIDDFAFEFLAMYCSIGRLRGVKQKKSSQG